MTEKHKRIAWTCVSLGFLLGTVVFQACAPPPPPKEIPVVRKDLFHDVPQAFILKARKNEKARDLPKAIFCWHIVQSFRPDDPEAKAEIQRLSSEAQAYTQKHYVRGLQYLQDKKAIKARDEFLLALFYHPDDRKIFASLQKSISPPETITYRVKDGDTNISIAKKVYRDPKKGFLVAYLAGSGGMASPAPGEILQLPIIESPPPAAKPRTMTSIQRARALFQRKKYREAISLAENIVAYGSSPAARNIINGSYYALALVELGTNRLLEAKKFFQMVDRNYKNTSDYIRKITNQLRVRADYHYKKGAQYFLNEKLPKAIFEWETTLRLNPHHARARADLKKARTMLKNLNGLQ